MTLVALFVTNNTIIVFLLEQINTALGTWFTNTDLANFSSIQKIAWTIRELAFSGRQWHILMVIP